MMKRFLFAAFPLMLVSTILSTSASAQTRVEMVGYNTTTTQSIAELTPFDLANFAYRGYLKSQGINSYGLLIQDHASGRIMTKDIVQAAINANRLSASTLNDRAYLNSLDNQLRELGLH